MIVGTTMYDTSHNEINFDDVSFFRKKEDKTRYFELQKHFETLNKFDNDLIDDLDYAICSTLGVEYGTERFKETAELFNKFKELISEAQTKCINESKNYL